MLAHLRRELHSLWLLLWLLLHRHGLGSRHWWHIRRSVTSAVDGIRRVHEVHPQHEAKVQQHHNDGERGAMLAKWSLEVEQHRLWSFVGHHGIGSAIGANPSALVNEVGSLYHRERRQGTEDHQGRGIDHAVADEAMNQHADARSE